MGRSSVDATKACFNRAALAALAGESLCFDAAFELLDFELPDFAAADDFELAAFLAGDFAFAPT